MNQMVDIVFPQTQYNQNNQYTANYSNSYGQNYRQREYDIWLNIKSVYQDMGYKIMV